MDIELSEVITKKAQSLASPLQAYLRKHAIYIYQVKGEFTSTYFLCKASAYSQLELIQATANSDLNDHTIVREDYHDLDNRIESFTLNTGVTFSISQHRILW